MSSSRSKNGISKDRSAGCPVKQASPGGRASVEALEDRRLLSAHVSGHLSTHVAIHVRHAVSAPVATPTAAATPAASSAPVITTPPNGTVNLGSTFTYQVLATGSPAPTFSFDGAPSGMTINATTGLISWTPTAAQVGLRNVTVVATNSVDNAAKSFSITVTNLVPPVITNPGNLNVSSGAVFKYQMAATGNPAPSFSLVSGPAGMTVDTTGFISWATGLTPLGSQNVTLSAVSAAGSASSTFGLSVVPDKTPPTAPVVTVGPITAVDSIPLTWSGSTDDLGVVGYRIFIYTPAVYRGHSGRGGGYTLVSPAKYTLLVNNIASTSYTITGLLPNSSHQYAVAAYDAAGNQSAYSTVVTGTTLLAPSFNYTYYGATNPPLSDVANHPITFYFDTFGNPTPTLSMVSSPVGVVFTPGQITNSQLTFVIPNISWTPTPNEVGLNYVTMQATNSVGTYTYLIPITVTPDTPQLSITLNGGITYGSGQFAAGQSNYQVTVNPAFGGDASPQYGMAGTPFNFQVSAASNTNPTTFALISGPAGLSVDPNSGAGTWTPTKDQAGTTNVTIAATNAAGTSTLELTFPTYFTGAPGTPAATYYTTTSGAATSNPTMSWAPPADTTGLTGYFVKVTDAHTNVTKTYDTQSSTTSFSLSGLGAQQYFVTVTPHDAGGNPGITSPAVSIYGAALPALSWPASSPAAVVGAPMKVQFSPSSAYTYSIVSGPAGATIDPSTGLLSWTPTDPGNATIVVAGTSNGWGTVDAVLNFPVYFTGAPASFSGTSNNVPQTGASTFSAAWTPPTQNLSAVDRYLVQIWTPGNTMPILIDVPTDGPLSITPADYGASSGSIQVTALDALGNAGAASGWVTF